MYLNPDKKLFNVTLILLALTSCLAPKKEYPYIKEGVIYLVIPLEDGCGSCIQTTYNFVKENKKRFLKSEKIDVIFTSIYSSKELNRNWDKEILESFILDTSNYYIANGLTGIYPCLLELNKNEISKFTFDPEYIDNYLHQLDSLYLK